MRRTSFPPRLMLVLLGLLAAVAISACGGDDDSSSGGTTGSSTTSSSSGESKPRTIAVNEYSREIPYFQEILKGMQKEAANYGWKIEPTFANNDPTQQINQIQNAITKKPDALVVIPIDENAIVPPIRQAKQAGVPVVTMGDNIAESGRDAQLTFLGVDYTDLGKEKAQDIVKKLNGQGSVGWIHGIRGLNFTERQKTGGNEVFKQNSGIKVVDGPYTGAFSSDKGLAATENLLSRSPNLDAIFFDNDDIALGGIQAIQEKGAKNIFTVGTDGGPAALNAVKAGKLDLTISLCGFAQGKQVIDVLKKYLDDGQKPPPEILTKTLEFSPENFNETYAKVKSGDC